MATPVSVFAICGRWLLVKSRLALEGFCHSPGDSQEIFAAAERVCSDCEGPGAGGAGRGKGATEARRTFRRERFGKVARNFDGTHSQLGSSQHGYEKKTSTTHGGKKSSGAIRSELPADPR